MSELFIERVMPELGCRVRLSLGNDLEVELALNLAVQGLQQPISDPAWSSGGSRLNSMGIGTGRLTSVHALGATFQLSGGQTQVEPDASGPQLD